MKREVVCVILAGGVSERFGGDKLLARYKGEEIIRRVCKAAKPCVDSVYISTRTKERAEELMKLLDGIADGYVVDAENKCQGPLRGIVTASELDYKYMLTLSADLPEITSEAITRFINRFMDYGECNSASIVWGNGAVETLIQLHAIDELRKIAASLCPAKGDISRPSDLLRGSANLLLIHGRGVTDNPVVLANVNRPEDLERLKPRAPLSGYVQDDMLLNATHSELFWNATESFSKNQPYEAMKYYVLESEEYLKYGIVHLAGHAVMDAYLVAEHAGDRERASEYRRRSRDILARMSYEYG